MKDSGVLYSATFKLTQSEDARKRQEKFLSTRKESQPLNAKSAGCIFRNPGPGAASAGALFDQNQLKGEAVGGAQVSQKHANFLVNTGGASCSDMRNLIQVMMISVFEYKLTLPHMLTERRLYADGKGSNKGGNGLRSS